MVRCVYIIVSSEDDYYTEQMFISLYTLKMHNPEYPVTILSDNHSYSYVKEKLKFWNFVPDELLSLETPSGYSSRQRGYYIRMHMREFLKGTCLYIDNDTIIFGSLDELETLPFEMAITRMQDSRDWSINNPHPQLIKFNKALHKSEHINYQIKDYFNNGVIFFRDTVVVHEVFRRWYQLWEKVSSSHGYISDQASLWVINASMGNIIQPLSGRFNCQAICIPGMLYYFFDCKIFHYFDSSSKLKNIRTRNSNFLEDVRANGITPSALSLIQNIRKEIINELYIIEKPTKDYDSILSVIIGKKIADNFPWFNRILLRLLRFVKHI